MEVVLYLWAYKILCCYSHYFSPHFDKIWYMGFTFGNVEQM